jgi:hypothetical protein
MDARGTPLPFNNNILGVACAWATLAKVSKALRFTHVRLVHYVADNSHSKADARMPALIARFVHFFNENPHIEWDAILMGLQVRFFSFSFFFFLFFSFLFLFWGDPTKKTKQKKGEEKRDELNE